MEKVFVRSDDVHKKSMDAISKNLTLLKATQVLHNTKLTGASTLADSEMGNNFSG